MRFYRIVLPLAISLLLLLPACQPGTAQAEDSFPSVSLWPLVTMEESANSADTDVLWPLFNYQRRDARTSWTLRPWLATATSDPDADRNSLSLLLGIFHNENRKSDYRRHLFPVYWQGDWAGDRWFYLWPLYGQEHNADGSLYDGVLPPLFGYRRNPTDETSSIDWLWPLGQIEKRHDGGSNRFFPLWWFARSGSSTSGYIFPYYWQRDPQRNQSKDAIFPVWYRQIDGSRRFSLFVPFWLHDKSPERDTTLLLPFWYAQRDQESSFAVLFPLHYRFDDANSRLRLTLPLHASYTSPRRTVDTVFPFYFRHRNLEERSDLFYLFPAYGSYTRGDYYRRNFILFPLYSGWQNRESGLSGWNLLWPLVHYERTPTSFESWLLPLFWVDRSESESMTMALGLWWSRQWDHGRFRLLAPLYLDFDQNGSGQTHLLPLYSELRRGDGYRKRFFVGPLWIDTRDPRHDMSQTDILWPLVSFGHDGDRSQLRVLPVYLQETGPGHQFRLGSLAFLPPYYVDIRDGEKRIWHLWPFYGFTRAPGYREDSALWPLLRYGRSTDGRRGSWQLLAAYADHDGDEGFSGLFPLWHRYHTARNSDTVTLVSWWRDHGDSERQFSLLHLGDPDLSLFTVSHQGERQHQHLLPLFWHSANPQAQQRDLALAWPLYTYRQRGETVRHRLLWKLLYTESGPDKSESGLLWRLIHAKSDAQESLFEFNPFYYRETHADGATYTAWLGGLYATLHHAGGTRTTLLWFIRFGEPLPR